MFYTIYDAIIFQMEKKGIKEDEVKRILRENGVKAEELLMLKNDCTALLSEEKLNKLYKKFGISKLEIELLMGNISREYEESYYEKVSVIASLLEKEKKEEKVKKLKEEFKTQKGKLYHADCLEILPGIKSETVDLIFADPHLI